jgi:hypothetical protein
MTDEKVKLLALFFTKNRPVDMYWQLLELDQLWGLVYEQHRIVKSFSEAELIANEAVIKHVLGAK